MAIAFPLRLAAPLFAIAAVAGSAAAGTPELPAPPGTLLVGNKAANTLWRLSLTDGQRLGEAPTAPAPHEIVVSRDGRIAVVSEYGHREPGHTLGVYDAHAGQLLRRIDLGANTRPHGMRFTHDGGHLLVTTEGSDALLQVRLDGRIERVFDIGPGKGHMLALSPDGRHAYVAKVEAGTVARVELATGEVLEKPAGDGAEGIAVARDGSVWVSNREADTVTVHDPETLDVIATLDSPGFPIRVGFSADGQHALVTNARAATLGVFSVLQRRPLAVVALAEPGAEYRQTMLGRAALPIGAVADPDGRRVYVAISGGNQVAVVDTARWKVVERWYTGDEPDALAIVPPAPAAAPAHVAP
ncbi:gluconolaconase [Pseudoxanthomonas sp. SGD-10]|nr:gluconolaconase [Pseudoxanthomonas sp. SGD-10]